MATAIKVSDELVSAAKTYAIAEHRSITKQIEHWARLGKAIEDNPDLPVKFIKDIMLGLAESKEGLTVDYEFDE